MNKPSDQLEAELLLDKAQARVGEAHRTMEAAQAQYRAARDEQDAAQELFIEMFPNGALLGSKALLQKAFHWAFNNPALSRRIDELNSTLLTREMRVDGYRNDPDEPEDQEKYLPVLTVALTRDQRVEQLDHAVRAWLRAWDFGKGHTLIDILETTCSANGSWYIRVDTRTFRASVVKQTFGHEDTLCPEADLLDALKWVAKNAWHYDPKAD